MRRFTWEEMRQYWENHAERRAPLDPARDEQALDNVCHPGAPAWFNRYHARLQERTYRRLLDRVPPTRADGARALDVGCGAGRWVRVLLDAGYEDVVGIDLQPALIAYARQRHQRASFCVVPIQEFASEVPFDLISSVTVLQHLPPGEQEVALAQIRRLLCRGGHFLCLENTRDQGPHVFARPIPEWVVAFERAGLELVDLQAYDFSPFSRALEIASRRRRPAGHERRTPLDLHARADHLPRSRAHRAARRLRLALSWVAIALDRALEPVYRRRDSAVAAGHCGFMLRAV